MEPEVEYCDFLMYVNVFSSFQWIHLGVGLQSGQQKHVIMRFLAILNGTDWRQIIINTNWGRKQSSDKDNNS